MRYRKMSRVIKVIGPKFIDASLSDATDYNKIFMDVVDIRKEHAKELAEIKKTLLKDEYINSNGEASKRIIGMFKQAGVEVQKDE